jgi:hypothetical protein
VERIACIIDSWVATASFTECPPAVREVLDPHDAIVPSLLDDVGRAGTGRVDHAPDWSEAA